MEGEEEKENIKRTREMDGEPCEEEKGKTQTENGKVETFEI